MLNNEDSPGHSNQDPNAPDGSAGVDRGIHHHEQRIPNGQQFEAHETSPQKSGSPILPVRLWRKFQDWRTDPYRIKPHIAEWITVFVTIVIAIIGALQYGVYRQQKKIMESSGQQTDQLIEAAQINACAAQQIADASERNATAAESFSTSAGNINIQIGEAVRKLKIQGDRIEASRKSSVESSQKALQAAIDNFHQEQRAWIGVIGIHIENAPLVADNPLKSVIYIINSGKTPAKKMTTVANAQLTERSTPLEPDYTLAPGEIPSYSLLQPGGVPMNITTDRVSGLPPPDYTFSALDINDLVAGRKLAYIYGRIEYEDVFGVSHFTTFCGIVNKDLKTVKSCTTYNDAN